MLVMFKCSIVGYEVVICCYVLLHNFIGYECELVHELELVWNGWNATVILKTCIFWATSSVVTGYLILGN